MEIIRLLIIINPHHSFQICEQAAHNQLMEYTIRTNCLAEHQTGIKNSTLQKRWTSLLDMILEAMDWRHITALVLLDLSKAFKTIKHGLLLKKLHLLSISRDAMECFRGYFTGRSQSERTGCELLDSCTVADIVSQFCWWSISRRLLPGIVCIALSSICR